MNFFHYLHVFGVENFDVDVYILLPNRPVEKRNEDDSSVLSRRKIQLSNLPVLRRLKNNE